MHDNIVQLLDVFAEGQHYVIVVRVILVHQQLLLLTMSQSSSASPLKHACLDPLRSYSVHTLPTLLFLVLFVHTLSQHETFSYGGIEVQILLLQWELVNGPDLLDLLNIAQSKRMPEPTVAHYFHQLINAVIFMHNNGFCHRDLKAENCVVDTSSQCVKVSCGCCLACTLSLALLPIP